MTFQDRIKSLRAEVEALKTVRRKSSTTLNTITHSATCTARLYKTSAGVVVCDYAGLVEITPTDTDNDPLIGISQPPYASRGNRDVELVRWVKSDGTLAILCTPGANSSDESMATESTKNVTLTIYITATSEFTTASSQVRSY